MTAIIPIPKFEVNIRPAVMEDVSFIDGLQKMHNWQVGFSQSGER